jgi:hypothetical protein
MQKRKSETVLADGGAKKEFPRSRSLPEPRFPLGNPLFLAAVRAAPGILVIMQKQISGKV